MNVFIFQSIRSRYDLRTALQPGKTTPWHATRYRSEMRSGDLVFFWMGGEPGLRGLYGWGRIVSEPYVRPDWDTYRVDVTYDAKFTRPILAEQIRSDKLLSQMLVFRAPQATNFLLSPEETERLLGIMKDHNEEPPSLEAA